jgi:hypothetical protein
MKKLFILLALFVGLNAFAQTEKFKGVWIEDKTESIRVINFSDTKDISIRNIHLDLAYNFDQTVLEFNDTAIKTKSYYPENEWTVYITYTLEDENTLVASYSGDYVGTTKHKRLH